MQQVIEVRHIFWHFGHIFQIADTIVLKIAASNN